MILLTWTTVIGLCHDPSATFHRGFDRLLHIWQRRHSKNNVNPVQSSQSSQSKNVEPDRRVSICLKSANQILSSSLPFVLGLCFCWQQSRKTSDGLSLRYTDGPLGVLNIHLSPVSPTPAPAAAIFRLCVSVQNPISGKQHVVIGYSLSWTLACVTRILRKISFDPRDISFALAKKNNSLLHRELSLPRRCALLFLLTLLGPVSAQLNWLPLGSPDLSTSYQSILTRQGPWLRSPRGRLTLTAPLVDPVDRRVQRRRQTLRTDRPAKVA